MEDKTNKSVSVIIPMRNSATTILLTLKKLFSQNYPIKEIIVVDNVSTDNSIDEVKNFRRINKKIPIYLIINNKNLGVSGSYNEGAKKATAKYIVLMHSDSTLKSNFELKKLVEPFNQDENVVATYSYIILPQRVWISYGFWQRFLFSKTVDKKIPGLNTKFDCIDRKIFNSIGGFDSKNYGQHIGVGSEDAAIHFALKKIGKVIKSDATVVHLHYLGSNFSLMQVIETKRLLARSYGRLIRIEGLSIGLGLVLLTAKPILATVSILSFYFWPFSVIIFLYLLLNDWGMYKRIKYNKDLRILLVPFLTFILIFFEAFWLIESFLYLNIKFKAKK